MASARIFIGSANESKEIAQKLALALGEAGHEPVCWWEIFRAGDITLDRIGEIAKSVDEQYSWRQQKTRLGIGAKNL